MTMTAERLLKEPLRLQKDILLTIAEIENIEESTGAANYDQPHVQGTQRWDFLEEKAMKAAELREQLEKLNDRYHYLYYDRIPQLLEGIACEDARYILKHYYLLGATMDKTADECFISRPTAYRYRKIGLQQLQAILDNEA